MKAPRLYSISMSLSIEDVDTLRRLVDNRLKYLRQTLKQEHTATWKEQRRVLVGKYKRLSDELEVGRSRINLTI